MVKVLLLALWAFSCVAVAADAGSARESLARLLTAEDASSQLDALKGLNAAEDPWVREVLAAWRQGCISILVAGDRKIPVLTSGPVEPGSEGYVTLVETAKVHTDARGEALKVSADDLEPVDTNARLRKAIKTALDVAALRSTDPRERRDAARKLGQEQNQENLPLFEAALAQERTAEGRYALEEALEVTRLAAGDDTIQAGAALALAKMRSISGLSFLKSLEGDLLRRPEAERSEQQRLLLRHLRVAILEVERHVALGNFFGTGFRGLSLGAVLLVASLGLAITFGLMGIINMAHGELLMVGAYATYMTQNLCERVVGDAGREVFFPLALGLSFLTAAALGLVLERGIVRHLYRRPLESMLATWGVSLCLRQGYRHLFGAANVQVDSPRWLSGSFVVGDVLFAYNRLFVIGFGALTIVATWLLLSRTSLGLQVRAVMQNRSMAAALGVRTERVNMLTFALGSGLAGVAGACLSQIGNVGPSLGQSYIVDCFMVVVLGGVGSLIGTVLAALGIGVCDQILQPWLGAVLGKISVLLGIILFLQWRPSGFFPQKSRSLDE